MRSADPPGMEKALAAAYGVVLSLRGAVAAVSRSGSKYLNRVNFFPYSP